MRQYQVGGRKVLANSKSKNLIYNELSTPTSPSALVTPTPSKYIVLAPPSCLSSPTKKSTLGFY